MFEYWASGVVLTLLFFSVFPVKNDMESLWKLLGIALSWPLLVIVLILILFVKETSENE